MNVHRKNIITNIWFALYVGLRKQSRWDKTRTIYVSILAQRV